MQEAESRTIRAEYLLQAMTGSRFLPVATSLCLKFTCRWPIEGELRSADQAITLRACFSGASITLTQEVHAILMQKKDEEFDYWFHGQTYIPDVGDYTQR